MTNQFSCRTVAAMLAAMLATVALCFTATAMAQRRGMPRFPGDQAPQVDQTIPSAPPVRLHVETSLLQIPVAVSKDGKPVTGLNRKDFNVYIDGRKVRLAAVDYLRPHTAQPAPQFPPGVKVNFEHNAPPNRVILLFDFLNIAPSKAGEAQYLQRSLLKMVRSDLPSGQQMAIYGLMPRLTLLQPFTGNQKLLSARINQMVHWLFMPSAYALGTGAEVVQTNGTQVGQGLASSQLPTEAVSEYDALQNGRDAMLRQQGIETLQGLESLARIFRNIPGHKTVIWVTDDLSALGLTMRAISDPSQVVHIGNAAGNGDMPEGVIPASAAGRATGANPANSGLRNSPLAGPHFLPDTMGLKSTRITSVVDRLNDADVSLYPLSLQGVIAPPDPSYTGQVGPSVLQARLPNNSVRLASINTMQTLGDATGGAALMDNNFGGEVNKAMRQWRSYYLISVVPPGNGQPYQPSNHKLKVKVKGKGLKLLFRQEYIARPASYLSQPKQIANDLSWALRTPVEVSAVPLAIAMGHACSQQVRNAKGAVSLSAIVPFTAMIAPSSIIHPDGNGALMDFSIQLMMLNASPTQPDQASRMVRVQHHLNKSQLRTAEQRDVEYHGHFEAMPGNEYFAALAVRDNLTGKMGSIRQRIELSKMPAACHP